MARGRAADSPPEIPIKGWKDIALRVKGELAADHVGLIAAGVAFYGLLAIFPGIAAIMAIAGLVTEPGVIVAQLESIAAMLPQEAAAIIIDQAKSVTGSEEGGLGLAAFIGVALAIWSASKGVASLMEGVNVAYDEDETRGFFRLTFVKLALTLGLMFGFLLVVLIMVALPALLALFQFGAFAETAAMVIRWPVLLFVAVVGLSILYRFAPSRDDAKWRWITPGAGVATLAWVLGSAAFAVYVRNFGSYNETFGTLGGVVILLMWLWLSAYIVLLGAELDAEMEAQTRKDTTIGDREPMGQRDAVKADELGEAALKPAE